MFARNYAGRPFNFRFPCSRENSVFDFEIGSMLVGLSRIRPSGSRATTDRLLHAIGSASGLSKKDHDRY